MVRLRLAESVLILQIEDAFCNFTDLPTMALNIQHAALRDERLSIRTLLYQIDGTETLSNPQLTHWSVPLCMNH